MACNHLNHDWDKDGGSFFVCADCGWESWDNTEWLPPYEEPNWDENPEAKFFGLYNDQWCYSPVYSLEMTRITTRPTPQPLNPVYKN